MDLTTELRKKHLLKTISHISRPDWIEKLEEFVNSLESSANMVEEQWGKYAEPIKEVTDWDEIADSQNYNLEFIRNYNGNLFEGEDINEWLKLLQ